MTIQEFCKENNLTCSPFDGAWLFDGGTSVAFKNNLIFIRFPLALNLPFIKFIRANNYWATDHWSGVKAFVKRKW